MMFCPHFDHPEIPAPKTHPRPPDSRWPPRSFQSQNSAAHLHTLSTDKSFQFGFVKPAFTIPLSPSTLELCGVSSFHLGVLGEDRPMWGR